MKTNIQFCFWVNVIMFINLRMEYDCYLIQVLKSMLY